ncbi:MAG: SpoIID/LytB domain-containing protein [Capsulimonadaceae bacterium]|nr:SpoIID/LytB domain-containing protein [Capsulimonadaceae bacterium]
MNLLASLISIFITLAVSAPLRAAQPAVDAQTPAVRAAVRVLLARFFSGAKRIYVSADGPFTVKDEAGNLVASGTSSSSLCVTLSPASGAGGEPGRLQVVDPAYAGQNSTDDADVLPVMVRIAPADPAGSIQIGAATGTKRLAYRGVLEVSVNSGGALRIVNVIGIEDYLAGVLKPEIGGDAPVEALKAQAVAARTYAVRNLGRLWADGADIDDSNRCQNYMGRSAETPAVLQAVDQTRGEVLIYNGAVIDALYCTECGGMTAEGPASEPYLRPVATAACAAKPGWTFAISPADFGARLRQDAGDATGDITKVEIAKADASGRALQVLVTGRDGTRTITGIRLRQILGVDNLRSTKFTVKIRDDRALVFTGQGWGHGLGMCQAGAIARASGANPETYASILADYYPGTQLTKLSASLIRRAGPLPAASLSRR